MSLADDISDAGTHIVACVVGCIAGSIVAAAVVLVVMSQRISPEGKSSAKPARIGESQAIAVIYDRDHDRIRVAVVDTRGTKTSVARWARDATIYAHGNASVITNRPMSASQVRHIIDRSRASGYGDGDGTTDEE